ncbi:hypothetical protein H4J50_18285, partial [Colwellia sp. 6M3]|uniref:hypothetical protein n=1 Tax=Colwellia sp. 6M3 TaxID=2759849 RepID=UPI0015F4E892
SKYIVREIVSFFKNLGPIGLKKSLINELANISIDGLKVNSTYQKSSLCSFLIMENTLVPLDYDLISNMKVKSIYIDAINLGKDRGSFTSPEFVKNCNSYLSVEQVSDAKSSRTLFVRSFFELQDYSWRIKNGLSVLPICGRRLLIKKSDVDDITTPGNVPKTFWNRLLCEWSNESWVLMSIGNVPKIDLDLEKITSELNKTHSFGFVCCYLKWSEMDEKKEHSIFSEAWLNENDQLSFVENA